MAQIIDISSRITNELPLVKISDDITITVNNRKNTILNVQAMVAEFEKKAKEDPELNEVVMIGKAIEMLAGAKSAKAIEELDLPMPEYKVVYHAIMAAATGTSLEDVDRFQG